MKSAFSVRTATPGRFMLAALLAVSACLLLAATSNAATISKSSSSSLLYFYGFSSEINDVVISDDGTTLTITDNSANITSVSGGVCTLVTLHTVTCPLSSVSKTLVYLYGGNDTVSSSASKPLSAYGGDGTDVLSGTSGQDVLRGDGGNDTIEGGADIDTLVGGNGNDTLDGGTGDDRLYGAAGTDAVSYASRTAPVDVDVTYGGGESGENDSIDADIENAYGGSGDDVIYGGSVGSQTKVWAGDGNDTVTAGSIPLVVYGQAGDDDLRGGGWDDNLYGNEGNDALHGGANPDSMFGQAGNDTIVASLEGDTVSGGADLDTVDYSVETTDIEFNLALNSASDLLDPYSVADTVMDDTENVLSGDGDDLIDVMFPSITSHVDCGGGYDMAYEDYGDTFESNCEFASQQ